MTALTADRYGARRRGDISTDGVAAGAKIYANAIVVRASSGYVQPATAATGLTGVGNARVQVDNTGGSDGAVTVDSERNGWFAYSNAGDVTSANIGAAAYAVDDQTISSSSNSNTRSVVGVIRAVDSSGVWISYP